LALQMFKVRRFLSRSAHVVFVSNWMRQAAEHHTVQRLPAATVIPNPIDTSKFRYAWQQQNLSHGVTARSLSSRKYGVDVAIRAISNSPNTRLSVVGTGSLESSLKRLATRLTAPVTFSGAFVPHDEMPKLYSRFGFFLAASRVEAQGVAMCEAMACGLPVVATNVGGIPEFVRHKENGFLAPRNDDKTLGEWIRTLTSDVALATTMSEAARNMVERTCSHDVVVGRELTVLREAAHAA
jgi:glycosyltransferase involved in cell wall biosynthesis